MSHFSSASQTHTSLPPAQPLFKSFFMGGFECSTHRAKSGNRLDLIESTGHDRFALRDYERLQSVGIGTARDGIRWHLIEAIPGEYDFSSVLPVLRAAQATDTQVIWDLFHYGWPDHLDIFSPNFPEAFARFAGAFARFLKNESDETPILTPVNEIDFFSWVSGDVGHFFPFAQNRGDEVKAQLVRASIAAIEAVWAVNPATRIVHTNPMINVTARPDRPEDRDTAEAYRTAQYQAWDMLSGAIYPELGGHPKYLDILGINYYVHNQWFYPGGLGCMIAPSQEQYRAPHDMMREIYERYRRPLFLAETGIEDNARPHWLRYMGREVRKALQLGVPVEGLCLYPIVNHPGWDDDRHCQNGLWDYADAGGERQAHVPLLGELACQMHLMDRMREGSYVENFLETGDGFLDTMLLDEAARWMEAANAEISAPPETIDSADEELSQMGAERYDEELNEPEEDMALSEALSFEVACLDAMFGDGNWLDSGKSSRETQAQYS